MTNRLSQNGLTPEQLIHQLPEFAEKLSSLISDIGINLSSYTADHIALRINDHKLTKEAHKQWLKYGTQISSAIINGRPIIVIELKEKMMVKDWQIECLELPYPIKGKMYAQEGWEHIECVISSNAFTADAFLLDLKLRFPALNSDCGALAKKGIEMTLSSPKGKREKLSNPTIAFKRDGIAIKLHPHSLKEVILSELV